MRRLLRRRPSRLFAPRKRRTRPTQTHPPLNLRFPSQRQPPYVQLQPLLQRQFQYRTHSSGTSLPISLFQFQPFPFLFSPKSSFLQPEEVADLEWVSHFIEDSFSKYSLSFPATVTQSLAEKPPEPGNAGFTFKTLVPAKPRSKRTRTGVRVWPLRSPSSFTDTSSPRSPLLIFAATSKDHHPEDKRAKKRAASDGGAARRCSHCGVQKTPQWRTGPLGAKTLCNACGVRYKSGRLLPEYRPACSPTFSSELHSNHHRKVLEMRQKKEAGPGPDTGSPASVPGF